MQGSSVVKIVVFFTYVISCTQVASALEPPCISYSYTKEGDHYFLLQDNSTMFGDTLIIKHNCDDLQLYLNGDLVLQSSNNATLQIPTGLNNFTFIQDNQTISYSNVENIAGGLSWYDDYIQYNQNIASISENESNRQINYVSLFTALIVWALSVNVYWRLINHYVDRNYFEEVK